MEVGYVTPEEAAGMLERHVGRVREALELGELPSVRVNWGQIFGWLTDRFGLRR